MARPDRGAFICRLLFHTAILAISVGVLANPFIIRKSETDRAITCHDVYLAPTLILGVLCIIASILGFVIVIWNESKVLKYVYTALIITLFVAMVITWVWMTTVYLASTSERVHKKAQNQFKEHKEWERVRTCLVQTKICENVVPLAMNQSQTFRYEAEIDILKKGCCQPPIQCGYHKQNTTALPTLKSGDCQHWKKERDELCFDCEVCKTAVVFYQDRTFVYAVEVSLWNVFILAVVSVLFEAILGGRNQENNNHGNPPV